VARGLGSPVRQWGLSSINMKILALTGSYACAATLRSNAADPALPLGGKIGEEPSACRCHGRAKDYRHALWSGGSRSRWNCQLNSAADLVRLKKPLALTAVRPLLRGEDESSDSTRNGQWALRMARLQFRLSTLSRCRPTTTLRKSM
jgi:hypothetical protein